LRRLRADGTTAGSSKQMRSFAELNQSIGLPELLEQSEAYAASETETRD